MSKIFLHTKKFILLLVALQVLNIGLFAQDLNSTSDDNIVNSITEYVAEVVLEKGDSFPENNNHKHHHQQHKHHHNFHLKSFHFKLDKTNIYNFCFNQIASIEKSFSLITNDNKASQLIFEIIPHPPKA